MKKIVILFLLSFYFCISSFAQTPSIRYIGPERVAYCLGTELALDIVVVGEFPKNSTFQLIARQYQPSHQSTQTQVCEAQLKDGQIITRITNPIFDPLEGVSLYLKNSSSDTELNITSVYIQNPTKVTLTSLSGTNADTVNISDPLQLRINATSRTTGLVFLDSGDSAWVHLNTNYHTIDLKRPYQPSYAIKEVRSNCNTIDATNHKVNIHLNEIDFKVVNASPTQLCEGNDLMVYFSSSRENIPTTTKFKVRFTTNYYYDLNHFNYIDVPAELVDKNTLKVKVPTFSNTFEGSDFFVGIVTSNPNTVSISSQINLHIYPKPSFKLTAQRVRLGEEIELASNPRGRPPFNFEFESGESMQHFAKFTLDTPTKTYKVKRFETGCGVFENPVHSPLTIKAEPSIYIGPMDTTMLCAGGTYRIPIKTTGGITSSTVFRAMVGIGYRSYTYFSGEVKGDYFEFTVPLGLSNFDNFKQSYSGIQVISQNPELTSNLVSIHFPDLPKIRLNQAASSVSLSAPGIANLEYELAGGLNYTINFADGNTVHTNQQSVMYHQVAMGKSADYTITSISNQCFINSDPVSTPITVANPNSSAPFIHLEILNQKRYCPTDSIEIYAHTYGKFSSDNRFELQFTGATNEPIPNIRIHAGYNKIKPQINKDGEYTLDAYLIATNPSLSTNFSRLTFQSTPRTYIPSVNPENRPAIIYQQGNNKLHIVKGDADEVHYTLNDEPAVYRFPANEPYLWSGTIDIPFQPDQLTKYTFLSASNECGTTYFDPPISTYYKSVRYDIALSSSQHFYCVEQPATFNFQVNRGTSGEGTSFTLQMQTNLVIDAYEDIQTVSARQPFHFKMPRKPTGNYRFRVISSEGVISPILVVSIKTTPSVSIEHSPDNANYATIPYGSTLPIFIKKNQIETLGVQFSDSTVTNDASYSPTVYKDQRFTISSAWNECGFGSAEGFVEVKVTPVIEFKSTSPKYDQIICPDKEIEVSYDLKVGKLGPNEYIIFKLSSPAMYTVKLDSTKLQKGTIKLKIPKVIYGHELQVTAEIASLKLMSKIIYRNYEQPSLTLYGDQYIAQGDYVTLMVKVNKPFLINRPITLSDGSVHELEFNQENRIDYLHIKNLPRQTTTYTINPIEGFCGNVEINGKATVVVTPRKPQSIIARSIDINRACNGEKGEIWFEELGLRNTDNEYEVLLKESIQGTEYVLPASGTRSPITIQIPNDIPESHYYKLYIRPKSPDISSGSWIHTSIYRHATATIETPYVQRSVKNSATVNLKLEGSKPISYIYLSEGRRYDFYTSETFTEDEIFLEPNQTSFELVKIQNQCGDGTILSSPRIEVNLITSIEKEEEETSISFGPNPTEDKIHFTFTTAQERILELVNSQDGMILQQQKSVSKEVDFQTTNYPSGIYLVRIIEGREKKVYKIVKH